MAILNTLRIASLVVLGLAGVAGMRLAQAQEQPRFAAVLKKLSVEELMDLRVTSVSKRPEKLSGVASAIQVITGEDIRRAGATSIPEALRLASNLEVARIDSRQWAITARGFNNTLANKMLVLIDGRTIYTPLYAGVFWDAQDVLLEDIERIEVISGPGATQWGANAVNGVINVITRSAKDTQGALVSAAGGSELHGSGGLRYGAQASDGLHYRVYAKYFDRDDSVFPNDVDATDAWHAGQGGFRVDWDRDANTLITVQGDLYDGAIRQAATPDIDISGGNVLGRWSRTLAEDSDVRLQLYYDRTHRRIPNAIEQDLGTIDLDFQHRFPLGGAHDIVWGASYRTVDDEIVNSATIAFLPARVSQEWLGTFVQDEIVLVADKLNLTVGAKLEHNDYTGFEIQPSIRAAWMLDSGRTLWGAVSRAVRTPARIDRDLFSPASPPFLIAGGPGFQSEKLLAYELGYRAQPRPHLVYSLATFYHDYDDLRSIEPLAAPAAFPVVLANGLRGKSYGAELTADYHVTQLWRLRLGYTELRVSSEPKPGSLDRTSTRSVALDPKRQALLRSSLDLPRAVECDVTLRYVDSIENQAVPAYTELDLRIGWRPSPSWELSLVGQNLLDEHHTEFGAAATRRDIERAIYGKLVWSF